MNWLPLGKGQRLYHCLSIISNLRRDLLVGDQDLVIPRACKGCSYKLTDALKKQKSIYNKFNVGKNEKGTISNAY